MDPLCLNTHRVKGSELSAVSFHPQSDYIITGSLDKTLHIHQIGSIYRRVDIHVPNPVTGIYALNKTNLIFCVDKIGRVTTAHPSIRTSVQTYTAHPSSINSIHFNSNETQFVTGSNDGSAKVWDFPTKKWLLSLTGHKHWVTCVEFAQDQNVISTSGMDRRVILWDIRTDKSNCSYGPFKAGVSRTSFHPSGSIIGVGLENGNFAVLDTRSQRAIQSYTDAHDKKITTMSFHPSGNFALTTSLDSRVRIWDLDEGQVFYTITAHHHDVTAGKWNADGSRFVTIDKSGVLKLWQTNFDKLVQTITGMHSSPHGVIESRIFEAMDIAPPPPKASAPEPVSLDSPGDGGLIQPSYVVIEGHLNRMIKQLDMMTNTVGMMGRRMEINEIVLQKLQERRKK